MQEFVVCPSCATRIKSGREYCLRCLEPLPDPDEPVRTPIWESLGLSPEQKMGLAVAFAVTVLGLVALIWQTQPIAPDDVARPVGNGPVLASAVPAGPSSPTTIVDRAPAVDSSGSASSQPPLAEEGRRASADPEDAALEVERVRLEGRLANRPDAVTLNALGQLLEKMGRGEEAAARFEGAVVLAPQSTSYRLNLARAASQLGQWDRAINQYRETVRMLPNDFTAQYSLAVTLQKKGDDRAAIAEFQRARRLGPSDPNVALSLGASLENVGQTADAIQEYRSFIDMRPNSSEATSVAMRVSRLSANRPRGH